MDYLDAVPWGSPAWPNRADVQFEYPDRTVTHLVIGTVFCCRIKLLSRDFYGVIGPDAAYFGQQRQAQFVYFLKNEPAIDSSKQIEADDLLLPPLRIFRKPNLFSPDGFPFVDLGRVMPPSAFFSSHPTDQPDWAGGRRALEGPLGSRPSPDAPNLVADAGVAWSLVTAHWLTSGKP